MFIYNMYKYIINNMKNYIRITFMSNYSQWLFTEIDKAVEFVLDVFAEYGHIEYIVDFLTKIEIAGFHHDYQYDILTRVDCSLDDYKVADAALEKFNNEFFNKIDEELER